MATAHYASVLTGRATVSHVATPPLTSAGSQSSESLSASALEQSTSSLGSKSAMSAQSNASQIGLQPLPHGARVAFRPPQQANVCAPEPIGPSQPIPVPPMPQEPAAQERLHQAQRDLRAWGLGDDVVLTLTTSHQTVSVRDNMRHWRLWAAMRGIPRGFVVAIYSHAIRADRVALAEQRLVQFSLLPLSAKDGRVTFPNDNSSYTLTHPAEGCALSLLGSEVATLLDKPSGLYLLWTVMALWGDIVHLRPNFELLKLLAENPRGDSLFASVTQVSRELLALGFDVEQLRKVMVTDQGDIKLLTARGHRDLFVFGAISATEYVQLCLDSRVCITELSCLLVERRGALAEARDASAGMPAPQ